MRCPTGRSTPASRSAPSFCTRGSRCCRRARASSPIRIRPPRTRSVCASWPRSRPRSRWRRAGRDPAGRQLRLVHVQPRAPVRRARLRGGGAQERRDRRGRGGGSRALASRDLAGAGPAVGRREHARDPRAARRPGADARGLPRAPGDRGGVRGRDRPCETARPREVVARDARRPRALPRAAVVVRGGALPLACGDLRAGCARGVGDVRRGRGDGRAAPRAAGRRCAVPSRVGADPGRARPGPELPGGRVIQATIQRLLDGHDLTRDEARETMALIMRGEATQAQIGGFLVALRAKGETADEIAGCAEAMRAHVLPVRPSRQDLVDTAGTGGDGGRTFNISTAAALVAAAAGAGVAKHGNRAVSSASGSADVLEALGFGLDLPPDRIAQSIDELGFGFMFAPTHHPAMKHAAPVRRELAARTVFNVLGPLTNPAGARAQIVGVYAPHLVPVIADVLAQLGARRAFVVHGAGGIDELSPAGPNLVCEVVDGNVIRREIDPLDLGVPRCDPAELRGGDATANAARIREVFHGGDGGTRSAILLNAAGAIAAGGGADDLREGLELAREALDSGAAAARLAELAAFSQGVAAYEA